MNIILYLTLIGLVFTAPIEKDAIEKDINGDPLALILKTEKKIYFFKETILKGI